MKELNLFKFDDHIDYLNAIIDSRGKERGIKGKLALAAGCQPSYLSQALRKQVLLTPEHGFGITRFLGLSEDETQYFLELVSHARAGVAALKTWHEAKLEQLRKVREDFTKRYRDPTVGGDSSEVVYYSAWYWSAVYVGLSIPILRSPERMATRLQLPVGLVREVLQGLLNQGLVVKVGAEWRQTRRNLHLPAGSPMTLMNHFNWRHKALDDVLLHRSDSIHFTGVHTLAKSDLPRLRQILFEAIDAMRGVIGPSDEEELICFTADLFRIG